MALISRLSALILCGLSLSSQAAAASVCVLVVEAGLPMEADTPESSSAWEAGMMDAFFDGGHIVWNGEMLRTPGGEAAEGAVLPAADFDAYVSRAGGADYLALVVLNYGETPEPLNASVRLAPTSVAYRLVHLGSESILTEGTDTPLKLNASGDEETREAGKVARIMMTRFKER